MQQQLPAVRVLLRALQSLRIMLARVAVVGGSAFCAPNHVLRGAYVQTFGHGVRDSAAGLGHVARCWCMLLPASVC